jgi:aminopeptidase N
MRTWSETWINESFATFSEYLYSRRAQGEDEGAINLLAKKNAYLQEARTRYIRPIVFDRYRHPNDNFDRHTYEKGAAVLNMLRFVMGDKPFSRAISHFLHKHAFKAVDTHDFMIAIKEATGQNLDWFFDQWVFKPGHPEFDISYLWDEGRAKLSMRVIQKQDTSQGIPVFKMPVTIGITSGAGKLQKRVWLENKEERFEFDVRSRPLMVSFDEGNHLLKEWTFNKSVDELTYQLKKDDVTGRMWAASELTRFKDDPRAVSALVESGLRDSFWAVRRSAVESIGKLRKDDHIEFLKQKAKDDNSKVRAAALIALGEYKKISLTPYFAERFEKDDSYLAQAEALRAIGKAGAKSFAPMLERAAKMNSPRDVIKTAAEWALRQILAEKPPLTVQ